MEGDSLFPQQVDRCSVSIRALAWRAIRRLRIVPAVEHPFQSAPSRGGRSGSSDRSSPAAMFQSAPSRGGRLRPLRVSSGPHSFNPRPRVEGDANSHAIGIKIARFNPRPRVEGDTTHDHEKNPIYVSIRALAWRAIRRSREETTSNECFNPRPRVEGDAEELTTYDHTSKVSIRALAWRAMLRIGLREAALRFQSAPSRGGRWLIPYSVNPCRRCFNPRPRVEGDGVVAHGSRAPYVSIRALAWRAMANYTPFAIPTPVSIRALAWRAISTIFGASPMIDRFNPRPRVEGDFRRSAPQDKNRGFQSAPSRGGRLLT